MRLIPLFAVLLCSAPSLMAEDVPFYQTPPGAREFKSFVGKQSQAQAIETTLQAIRALNQQSPGQPAAADVSWVTMDADVWRNTEAVADLSTFIAQRLNYKSVLSTLEMKLLTTALHAMSALPPAPGTGAVRRTMRDFYDNSYAVDDLTILAQHQNLCDALHILCNADSEQTDFAISDVAKRFERRERYLKDNGAPAASLPTLPATDNPF
jgi:hypothetical protein